MKKFVFISLLTISIITSCADGTTRLAHDDGDTIHLKYAEHLQMTSYGDYTVVSLKDPWNEGKVLHTYILIPDSVKKPEDIPSGTVVRTPLKRAVITTSVHNGLIVSFGKAENIKGVCDSKYINIPAIRQKLANRSITDCGSGITPNVEKIIDINADAILISPFQNSGGYGRLTDWGNPIIETADYMETSALGRAEWMKFYGMLFGAEKQADSIFSKVEHDYNMLKETALKAKSKMSVLIDKINGSVWYVPGGKSTIGGIIADSNTGYPFAGNGNSGSLPLSFEIMLEKAGNTDAWLFRYNSEKDATYESLLSEHGGYSQFKAFKTKNIYGCNTYNNTFYEDTPFHPELLLRDFIIITHPELKQLGETKYFKKLK